MNHSKLRKKVLRMSLIILGLYIVAVVINHSALVTLLPIIIPTSILTISIPIYTIIKSTKGSLDSLEFKPPVSEDKTKEVVLDKQEKKNYVLVAEYSEEIKKEKNKVKTKGTWY